MARDINKRLGNLKSRRSGFGPNLDPQRLTEAIQKYVDGETWEKRSSSAPYTRFALGAMQEVDATYTQVSIETGKRIRNQLETGFARLGGTVETRMQGSVPLNVHIRGFSDVDVLVLATWFLSYDAHVAKPGSYIPSSDTSENILRRLRLDTRKVLEAAYPAAEVDNSGSKAIKISGGSLPRSVDVVPSHWWDTAAYQGSGSEDFRGVIILDTKSETAVKNLPFLHIMLVNLRDSNAGGGLKKAIRLCKNVKAEANEEGKNINLSSFDIAGLMYHADQTEFAKGSVYELAILAEAQRFLEHLSGNFEEARKLMVPDGSRRVIDSVDKFLGLVALSAEMTDLANEVAAEQMRGFRLTSAPANFAIREILQKALGRVDSYLSHRTVAAKAIMAR